MNKKVILEQSSDGTVLDAKGYILGMHLSLESFEEVSDSKSKLKGIIKLKEAGFTSEEIIDMSKEGLL